VATASSSWTTSSAGPCRRNFIPSVEKGIRDAMKKGILAGYPIVDLKVTLYDGSYHDVDSSDMAFQIAASFGLQKGFMEANPILLEPVMNVEVVTPSEQAGDVIGDLNSRRGRIMGMEPAGETASVRAQVPMAEMLTYETSLRSMTGGRGGYSMEFSHYERGAGVPGREGGQGEPRPRRRRPRSTSVRARASLTSGTEVRR
jgi:elongation factor G